MSDRFGSDVWEDVSMMLGLDHESAILLELAHRIGAVRTLVERCCDGTVRSRQILAVIIEQYQRETEREIRARDNQDGEGAEADEAGPSDAL